MVDRGRDVDVIAGAETHPVLCGGGGVSGDEGGGTGAYDGVIGVGEGAWRYAKWSMAEHIERRTGVRAGELRKSNRGRVSVARKMSWMSRRQRSRSEDRAYTQMGLFDVSMPVLYGEGEMAAFERLQRMVIEKRDDETIFSWSSGSFEQ